MKNFKYLLLIVLMMAGCAQNNYNGNDASDSGSKSYITIRLSQSRTIMPEALDAEQLTYVLTGSRNNSASEKLGEFSYAQLSDAKIEIAAGTWDFTLIASRAGQNVLTGRINGKVIAEGSNSLEFAMQECDTGTGSVSVTVRVPQNKVAQAAAVLYDMQNNQINDQTLTVTNSESSATALYNKDGVSKGNYLLKISLFQNEADEEPINIKTVIVQVEPGCVSSGTVSFSTVNTYWAIKYHCNGLKFVTDYVPPSKYNSYTQITLPSADKIDCSSDIYIIGWSDTDSTKLYEGQTDTVEYGSSGEKNFYLKYYQNIRCSAAELDKTLKTINKPQIAYRITITDSNPNLENLRNIITSDVSGDIYLNLTECSGLTNIDGSLADWTQLAGIDMTDCVTNIADGAFSGCKGLTSVTIGSGVTSIGDCAFGWCNGLKKVNYTGTIAQWCGISFDKEYSSPLYYTDNLYISGKLIKGDLVIPDGVAIIGDWVFSGCNGLRSVTIPDSVKSIGDRAFSGCKGLTSVTIGSGVTSIGGSAFYNCDKLTSVTIPNSVTSICDYAFGHCDSLESLTVLAETPPTAGENMLYNCSSITAVYVPSGSVNAYQSADGWKTYAGKIVAQE